MAVVTTVEKKTVNLDDVLVKFNIFGLYYSQTIVLIFFAYATNSIFCSNYVFVAEEIDYRCKDVNVDAKSCSSVNNENGNQTCSQWVYDNPNSFVAEFDLACQPSKRTMIGMIHSVGYMAGLLLVGPLSDRIGRKKMIVITGMLGGVFGVARSFTTSYWLYIALEFLEAAIGDICSPVYMLSLEIVPSNKRLIFQMICAYGYTTGAVLLPVGAYLIPYWRDLLRVLYAPALLFYFYTFLLDESPRWLLSKGKKEKAVKILEKIARRDSVNVDKNIMEKLSFEQDKSMGLIELLKCTFRSGKLLKRFFICLTWWTVSTFVNYGLTINSVSLQGNKYVNFALISIVDIPGSWIITYVMIRYNRKFPLLFSFMGTAILCIVQAFVPSDLPWLSVTLYMLGKFMSSAFFNITYMFTSELFPTYTRNSMHALCSSLGRIGSIVATETPLLIPYWSGLPSVIFGVASLLAGLVTFFAPDIKDNSLPDNVKQAEAIGVDLEDASKKKPVREVVRF